MDIQLNDTQIENLRQAELRLTTLYTLPDICEGLMQDVIDYRKKAGFKGFKYEQKKYWNAFLKDAYNLRKVMKGANEEMRTSYADVCDLLQTILLLIVDRSGDCDVEVYNKLVDFIKSFPSKRNMEISA